MSERGREKSPGRMATVRGLEHRCSFGGRLVHPRHRIFAVVPPLAPSPGINIYTDHWFILLFWLRFWLRFGHGLGHGCQYTSITTDRTVKWPNPLYPQGNVSVCHSCSLSVSRMLGRSTDLGVGGSSPSGRTTDSPGCTLPTSETSSVVVALVTTPKRLSRFTVSRRYSGRGMSYVKYTAEEFSRNHQS